MKGCRMEKTKAEGRRMGSGMGHPAVMLGLKQNASMGIQMLLSVKSS